MNYLREGDTPDHHSTGSVGPVSGSLWHSSRSVFKVRKIDILVVDQNIDTSTSTGRLMFNMLAAIAEFENDLRTERQAEGLPKQRKMV